MRSQRERNMTRYNLGELMRKSWGKCMFLIFKVTGKIQKMVM
jgi:hypothetical protein